MTQATLETILARAPLVPVLAIDDLADAVPLAEALAEGGLPVLEVTLRTAHGLAAIEAMATALPEASIGVGTITRPEEFSQARSAGAVFAVSPGCTAELSAAARSADIAFLPGVATASEVLQAQAQGAGILKLFPAEAVGGVALLKSLAGPFADVRFCPTGGIGPANMMDYLRLANVVAVGGSWVAPRAAVAAKDWRAITKLARAAVDQAAE